MWEGAGNKSLIVTPLQPTCVLRNDGSMCGCRCATVSLPQTCLSDEPLDCSSFSFLSFFSLVFRLFPAFLAACPLGLATQH